MYFLVASKFINIALNTQCKLFKKHYRTFASAKVAGEATPVRSVDLTGNVRTRPTTHASIPTSASATTATATASTTLNTFATTRYLWLPKWVTWCNINLSSIWLKHWKPNFK